MGDRIARPVQDRSGGNEVSRLAAALRRSAGKTSGRA